MISFVKLRLDAFANTNPLLVRLFKNAGILFSGNAASALLSLIALSFLSRALGPENFGLYALLTAYIALIDRLVTFQTWQALIHYGAKAWEGGAFERLSSLLLFGFLLDLGSGLAGALLAIAGVYLVPGLFGLDPVPVPVVWVAMIVLLFNWISTPTAVLRLFDKFTHQAAYQNISAMVKLCGYLVLWLYKVEEIGAYIAVWAVSTVIGRLYLFAVAWRMASQNGLLQRSHIDLPLMISQTPGLWRFVLTTNLDGIVRILREIDIFIVNGILGPAGAGLYRIARDLARIPSQLTGPFYQAIYPDLSRLAANGKFDELTRLMRQSSLSLGLFISLGWLTFIVAGKWIITLAFGSAYMPAYFAAVWCMGGVAVWAFAQPLAPGMLSLGKVQTSLIIHLITSLAYILLLSFLALTLGLTGAGFAFFVFYALWSLTMLFFFVKNLSEQREK